MRLVGVQAGGAETVDGGGGVERAGSSCSSGFDLEPESKLELQHPPAHPPVFSSMLNGKKSPLSWNQVNKGGFLSLKLKYTL